MNYFFCGMIFFRSRLTSDDLPPPTTGKLKRRRCIDPRHMCVSVCVSEDMSPYCLAHDEWLIMKLCVYVGYHDANNVSNYGGDPVTQFNLKNFHGIIYTVLRTWGSIAVTRPQFLRRLLRDHVQTAAVWKTVAVNLSFFY